MKAKLVKDFITDVPRELYKESTVVEVLSNNSSNKTFFVRFQNGKELWIDKNYLDVAIDWEQRRYEIAKDFFCQLTNNEVHSHLYWQNIATKAVKAADTLIEKLKGNR